MYLFYNLIYK